MRKLNLIICAATVAGASLVSSIAGAATLVTFGDPWGEKSTVTNAMDSAFGGGNWADLTSPAGTGFLAGESYVYLEGGDNTTNAMEAFLTTNGTALLNWVTAGGSLFINAAPNEGDGLTFGGLTLNFGVGPYCNSNCAAVDTANAIFDGAGTVFTGNFFSHGTVSGGTALIENANTGDSLLSELAVGSGFLMMGTMTTTNFHGGGDPELLRSNILEYGAAGGQVVMPAPVPLPASAWLLIGAFGALGAAKRRKTAA